MANPSETLDDVEVGAPRSGISEAPLGLIGRTIDRRYRVESKLGEGGMGLVYRVTHTQLNKPQAIKVLRREHTRDEEALARFRREAESASGIGNQHIVDISDFGMLEDGSTYFVMEYLEGMDLIDTINLVGYMPEERAIHIAKQVCRALGAAHRAGIVHRDLKPENVFLVTRDGTDDFVKILDFGIAKVGNLPTRITRAGEVLGTPHYMSPEQCEGDDVDHRTDVYAMGVLLYEMVTGQVPHDAETMTGILTKHLYDDPIPPTTRVPQVSAELEGVIMRCLEKKPGNRYQAMHEIETDLERIRSGEAPIGPDTLTLSPSKPPAPSRRRLVSPIYLAGLAVALVALVGSIAAKPWVRPELAPGQRTLAPPPGAAPVAAAPAQPEAQPDEPEAKRVEREPKSQARRLPLVDSAIIDPWK